MKTVFLISFFVMPYLTQAQLPDFNSLPVYDGVDLGLRWSPEQSTVRIWSPMAEAAECVVYAEGSGGEALKRISMTRSTGGTWTTVLKENILGKFYAFRVMHRKQWSAEVPDPYARAAGVNGRRAMVVDPKATDPPGWDKDRSPAFGQGNQKGAPVDAVIYELHVRDASIHASSGVQAKGKFIGLTEKGTRNAAGQSTGLDHLKELGVTHVHLLPSYDFYTVDESRLDSPQYNWGYDPLNYNLPEGSYSTNPFDGAVRIREFKQLIKTFHENGLRVVMDVVYNHTMFTEKSWFNELVPGYYYRQKPDGSFSDASACGNETASERAMMRKFMLESVRYWVEAYHIDGFRFDLMGIHDIETMNLISKELHALKPDILLYGEGWTAGASPLPDSLRALKKNAHLLDGIAVFSDDIRDGIKGSVFDHADRGFASGKPGMEESIRFGVVAACRHPQVDYAKVNYSKAPYAAHPGQTVTYCECHDNHVLWDKLKISAVNASEAEREAMHRLALTMVLSSQGISFLHAGTEFLRSKSGVENSFNSGDQVNAIDWNLKTSHQGVFEYVRDLIRMRRKHPAFRMRKAEDIAAHLEFAAAPAGMVAYTIRGKEVGDTWKKIFVGFNGQGERRSLTLPSGKWKVFVQDNRRPSDVPVITGKLELGAYTAAILYQE